MQDPEQPGQHQAAQGEQIQAPSGEKTCHDVQAHLSVFPEQCHPEQQSHRSHPEQQIQHKAHNPSAGTAAQRTQYVVAYSQGRSQQQAQQQHLPLSGHIHVHTQRSSRVRKPPCVPRPSS